MNYLSGIYDTNLCTARISVFPSDKGIEEQHIMLQAIPGGNFKSQLSAIHDTRDKILSNAPSTILFQRYFLSDAANQAGIIREASGKMKEIPTSIIQQPPLDGSKVALWIYLHKDVDYNDSHIIHNGYEHLWVADKHETTGTAYHQTENILEDYNQLLTDNSCTLKNNCIRTWFFVQDVDTNYADFVKARKEYFDKNGLTDKTHYIASTGIEGRNDSLTSLVSMDAYSIKGILQEQIIHLHALSHLSPTNIYGVTFERGVAVQYGDRKHIFISGTASIDSNGDVVHIGDVKNQTLRLLENIEMLLKEGNASFNDIAQGIVYLRDTADYSTVKEILDERFPELPLVITLAPVCRPTWLVEMECIAVTSAEDKRFRDF